MILIYSGLSLLYGVRLKLSDLWTLFCDLWPDQPSLCSRARLDFAIYFWTPDKFCVVVLVKLLRKGLQYYQRPVTENWKLLLTLCSPQIPSVSADVAALCFSLCHSPYQQPRGGCRHWARLSCPDAIHSPYLIHSSVLLPLCSYFSSYPPLLQPYTPPGLSSLFLINSKPELI